MILQILGWLLLADAIGASVFAAAVYVIGRRSDPPVTVGKAAGLAGCLTIPAVLLYLTVWLWVR